MCGRRDRSQTSVDCESACEHGGGECIQIGVASPAEVEAFKAAGRIEQKQGGAAVVPADQSQRRPQSLRLRTLPLVEQFR